MEKEIKENKDLEYRPGGIASNVVITASDTIEETIANRNNALAKENNNDCSKYIAYASTTIDIDNAKWQKDYSEKMDRNLDRFKELGLYSQLQEMGILYDERQFQKTRMILSGGKSYVEPNPSYDGNSNLDVSYEEVEKQFDEQLEREKSKKEKT